MTRVCLRDRNNSSGKTVMFCELSKVGLVLLNKEVVTAPDCGQQSDPKRAGYGQREALLAPLCYLLGAENHTIRGVFTLLAELTGLPVPARRVPYAVALAAAHVSEFVADVWTRRMPIATVTGVRLTRRVMSFDARRSLDELGLRPRPVREALADALDWFRAAGWL